MITTGVRAPGLDSLIISKLVVADGSPLDNFANFGFLFLTSFGFFGTAGTVKDCFGCDLVSLIFF